MWWNFDCHSKPDQTSWEPMRKNNPMPMMVVDNPYYHGLLGNFCWAIRIPGMVWDISKYQQHCMGPPNSTPNFARKNPATGTYAYYICTKGHDCSSWWIAGSTHVRCTIVLAARLPNVCSCSLGPMNQLIILICPMVVPYKCHKCGISIAGVPPKPCKIGWNIQLWKYGHWSMLTISFTRDHQQ